jgi:hypothetical protein
MDTQPQVHDDCETCILGLLAEVHDIQNAAEFPSQQIQAVDAKALATQRPSFRRLALPLFDDQHKELQDRKWPDNSIINVQFRNHEQPNYAQDKKYHDLAIAKVKEHVKKWEACTNLTFNFINVDSTNAAIRVAFLTKAEEEILKGKGIKDFRSGSWSVLGTPSRDQKHVSMNLDVVQYCLELDSKQYSEWAGRMIQRKVLHEFGHAMGFIHEHLRADAPFKIDVDAALKANGWDKGQAHNFTNLWPKEQLKASPFDVSSIMIYSFSQDQLMPKADGTKPPRVEWVYQLSKMDQEWAGKIYPKKP